MTKKYQVALAGKTMIKDQSLLRHEDIKQHIRVLPELAAYIPPLLPDEYKQLEENIKQNGCREALLVWETAGEQIANLDTTTPVYILIDGHNRYAICQKYKLDFKVYLMNFSSIEEVKFFMIDNQLGRRNLAPEQVSYLRGLRYLKEKQEKGKYLRDDQKGQSDLYEKESDLKEVESEGESRETTAHRLGKQFSVSEKTIKRDGAYAQGLERLTPDFRQDILSGKIKVDKGMVQQLGRSEKPLELISNQAKLDRVIQQDEPKGQTDSKSSRPLSPDKTAKLKQELYQLVSQLNAKKTNINQLCNEIIECARQLQQQGK
ncbi:hypothetical protein [Spirosoma flavum]|uniref:ParB N-terminal domain-containing protein n=1 Tax=Spirosoma flavum TaxID=2048557 RepID=A0ABW6AUH3_9BACT